MTIEQRHGVTAMNQKLAERIAYELRTCSEPRFDLLSTLCDIAGLTDEWVEADFDCDIDRLYEVAGHAAAILGVEI